MGAFKFFGGVGGNWGVDNSLADSVRANLAMIDPDKADSVKADRDGRVMLGLFGPIRVLAH